MSRRCSKRPFSEPIAPIRKMWRPIWAWIANMLGQDDTDGAIKEYRLLVERVPDRRLQLAQLLIEQNQRRPERQRDWNEVTELIEQAAKASPESIKPVILKAELLFAQGSQAAA